MKYYTDGAATMKKENNNYVKGDGGWAFAVVNGEDIVYSNSGGEKETTHNRMELMAIYQAALYAVNKNDNEIEIYSDSAYCCNIFNSWAASWERNNWTRESKKLPIENLQLIQSIWELVKEYKINFIKVKGHSNNIINNEVDKLAVEAKIRIKNA